MFLIGTNKGFAFERSIIAVYLGIVSSRVGTLPFLGKFAPERGGLSDANLKSYPLFLKAIQIGACKL